MATMELPLVRNDRRLPWRWLAFGVALCGLGSFGPMARATEPRTKPAVGPARLFLARHCQTCHSGNKPKGKFRVDSLTQDFGDKANRERWLAVFEQLKTGAMPPKEKPRPPATEVKALTEWISGRHRTKPVLKHGSACAGSTAPSTRTRSATCSAWNSI